MRARISLAMPWVCAVAIGARHIPLPNLWRVRDVAGRNAGYWVPSPCDVVRMMGSVPCCTRIGSEGTFSAAIAGNDKTAQSNRTTINTGRRVFFRWCPHPARRRRLCGFLHSITAVDFIKNPAVRRQ
jgi:hypothetical protein